MLLAGLGTLVFGQNQFSYYIVEEVGSSLEPQSKTTNSNGYTSGIYTVTLVCNGAVVDSKNLIKN